MTDPSRFHQWIPQEVRTLISRLRAAGYDTVLVGGCVRDLVLGQSPSDFDIATAARPDEVLRVFSNRPCLTVGKAFGTVIVPYRGGHAEVTTYREETGYSDGRHPDAVRFTTVLEKDLARRDFTINAIAWRPGEGLTDPFGGADDLADGRLRAVGEAGRRLEEDALRILRGIRFAARFQLVPDPDFLTAARAAAEKLSGISPERIYSEIERMLTGPRPAAAFRGMEETGALAVLFPELAQMPGFSQDTPYHHLDLWEHTLCILEKVPPDPDLRWAALLHDAGKVETKFFDETGRARYYGHDKVSAGIAETVLARLRAPVRRIGRVEALVMHHMASANPYTKRSVKKLLRRLGVPLLEALFHLQEADCLCASNQGPGNVQEGRKLLAQILTADEPYLQNQLAISGHDLLAIGIPEGPEIGKWLKKALEWVQEQPERNDKQILLDQIQDKRRK